MLKDFRETLAEQLRDPEFRREWDAMEPEFQAIKSALAAQDEKALSAGAGARDSTILKKSDRG